MGELLGAGDALRISSSCTWCGFCESVCPTYLITGEKYMGPRGRTWLTQMLLKGRLNPDQLFVKAIYSCITCKACINTCPAQIDVPLLMSYVRSVLLSGFGR